MKIIVGDEFGLIKCIDTGKKQIDSKYGEIKKKNGVIGIDNLHSDNRNILGILFEYKFQLLDWRDKNLIYEKIDELGFTSMIIKQTIDFR